LISGGGRLSGLASTTTPLSNNGTSIVVQADEPTIQRHKTSPSNSTMRKPIERKEEVCVIMGTSQNQHRKDMQGISEVCVTIASGGLVCREQSDSDAWEIASKKSDEALRIV
jgi:hypothetical protein